MNYKLLVLDVDGTLLNSEHKITNRTKMALLKIQQLGIKIVLASGRPPFGLTSIVEELEINKYGGYVIAYNGSSIIDASTGKPIFQRTINPELLPFFERKARKNGFAQFTYSDDKIITDTPDNPHIIYEAELNGMMLCHESEFSTAIDFSPYKVVLVSDDEEKRQELSHKWLRKLNGTVEVHRSEDYFLEVLPQGIDKSVALSFLMDYLHITKEQVVSIGNGIRDVGLLQLAGTGIAMGNASESVRACADIITDTNDADGVAKIIEKTMLSHIETSQVMIDELNKMGKHSLIGALGITYTFASPTRIEATMPVNENTRQPFGILHGGATLALAETVAGFGSILTQGPDETTVGMQVSGNHISSAHEGDTVRAVATLIHKGRSSNVWNVDVFTSLGKLVSSVRVLNSVMKRK
ncbi:MAG: Cof-type HAD-IIB family hydrolase [Prevotellaceae bacterium]|nr:Cof-type HAD-IIB family hydrolase [Candidatus Faecinaster equi]